VAQVLFLPRAVVLVAAAEVLAVLVAPVAAVTRLLAAHKARRVTKVDILQ